MILRIGSSDIPGIAGGAVNNPAAPPISKAWSTETWSQATISLVDSVTASTLRDPTFFFIQYQVSSASSGKSSSCMVYPVCLARLAKTRSAFAALSP